ncbi:DM13 domain-containing protein [Nonomuraea sp. NPDC049400]|uniref:DM13 domain-containing protein n=1 Tax=Nonomuraea sp. NPDC049400 TaxID=3364352 RepID=UPI0037AA8910
MKLFRRPVTLAVVGLGAVIFAIAMYLFQPWRLFTTVRVNEPPPMLSSAPHDQAGVPLSATPSAKQAEQLARGTFVSHEHKTTGMAKVLRLPDGSRVLRLADLSTSDGPDLRVWLSDQPVTQDWFAFDDGRHLELGHLKGNQGNSNYSIPAGADLSTLKSVTIWCKRFSVSFGAAALS